MIERLTDGSVAALGGFAAVFLGVSVFWAVTHHAGSRRPEHGAPGHYKFGAATIVALLAGGAGWILVGPDSPEHPKPHSRNRHVAPAASITQSEGHAATLGGHADHGALTHFSAVTTDAKVSPTDPNAPNTARNHNAHGRGHRRVVTLPVHDVTATRVAPLTSSGHAEDDHSADTSLESQPVGEAPHNAHGEPRHIRNVRHTSDDEQTGNGSDVAAHGGSDSNEHGHTGKLTSEASRGTDR